MVKGIDCWPAATLATAATIVNRVKLVLRIAAHRITRPDGSLVHAGARTYAPNLLAARALAFTASSSRLFAGAAVSRERRSRADAREISSTAAANEASFAFDGLVKPLILRTNWSDAARISSSVTGGSKLKSVLMFLHIQIL